MANREAANHTAPTTWEELLHDAVTIPGKVSECYHLFHSYSIGNQMLAYWQCASRGIRPGPLATYNGWASKGRQVKRGEKAIVLCQPVTFKDKNAPEDEKKMVTVFKYYPRWFVVSQTDGQPVEPEVTPEWNRDTAIRNLGITEAPFEMMNGNCQGYARPKDKTIAINPVAEHPVKTTIHELAHCLLHAGDDGIIDGSTLEVNIKELEAEATALIVSDALGLPGQEYSRGYIQSWYGMNPVPEASARRIFTAADKILKAGSNTQNAPSEA